MNLHFPALSFCRKSYVFDIKCDRKVDNCCIVVAIWNFISFLFVWRLSGMFLSLSSIFMYLSASPRSRCIVEREAVLAANHIIVCGVKEKKDNKWTIRSICLQTSAVKSDPHEIKGIFSIISGNTVEIETFTCSCEAGVSESCKHVAATLSFCSRKPLEELEELSCTDTECLWRVPKSRVIDKYSPQPLSITNCFKPIKKRSMKCTFSRDEIDNMFQMASSTLPNSSFALHRQGRRKNVEVHKRKIIPEIPSYVEDIFSHSIDSSSIQHLNLNIPPDCQTAAKLNSLSEENALESMCCKKGTSEWKKKRKNEITGSTCYSIFTFNKQDWTKMLANFFSPKSIETKEMRHGVEQESFAFDAVRKINPNFDIRRIGISICQKYPWLAYSPDGIIFEHGKPSRLLEIKCPYLGKIKSGPEVSPTLEYLNMDCTLKEGRYYARIQFGMALLNLQKCEFIIYFSKHEVHLHISMPFEKAFAKQLIETVSL